MLSFRTGMGRCCPTKQELVMLHRKKLAMLTTDVNQPYCLGHIYRKIGARHIILQNRNRQSNAVLQNRIQPCCPKEQELAIVSLNRNCTRHDHSQTHIPLWSQYGLIPTAEKRGLTCTHVVIHLSDYSLTFVLLNVGVLELLACVWCCWELVHLYVYSRLTTSPSSLDGTVHRRLHTLPTVTVWLGCPRFGCLA